MVSDWIQKSAKIEQLRAGFSLRILPSFRAAHKLFLNSELYMTKNFQRILISVLLCVAVGALSGIATQSSVDTWYVQLTKPAFNPPNAVFAPVWTVLYVLMGLAAGLVWNRGFHHLWVKTALYHFGFQLLLNALWSVVFFGLRNPGVALLVIAALLILILLTMRWFRVVYTPAAWLMLPYLLWVLFASVLNYEIWRLN